MPVIGSNSEILKEYLAANPLGNVYLGSTQVQFGNVPVVETPYYWYDPFISASASSWSSSYEATATDGNLTITPTVLQKSEPPTKYYQLSGTSDQITAANGGNSNLDYANAAGQGKTFVWWMNVNEADYTQEDGSAVTFMNGNTSQINWAIVIGQNIQGTGSYFRPDGDAIESGTDVAIPYSGSNEWVMMAMNVYTEGNAQVKIKGYLNGENVTDYNSGEQFSTITVNTLKIGYADLGPVTNESDSAIGDILIYTSSLDDGEISQIYKALKPKYI